MTGKEVVLEDLRQICLYTLNNVTWWNYAVQFSKQCINSTDLETCSQKIYSKLGFDKVKVDKCVRDSFGNSDNTENDNSVLAQERSLFLGEGIQIWPSIRVNNITYRVKKAYKIKFPLLYKKTGQFGACGWSFRRYL